MPRCPICHDPMTSVAEPPPRKRCPECQGTWVADVALRRWINTPLTGNEAPIAQLAAVVAAAADAKNLRCPGCDGPLTRGDVHQGVPVKIDGCTKCHAVWLRAGTVELARALYQELMTSTDPDIIRRREGYAQAGILQEQFNTRMGQLKEQAEALEKSVRYAAWHTHGWWF